MIKIYYCQNCKTEVAKTAEYWKLGDKGKTFSWQNNKYTITGDEYGHAEDCPKFQKWPREEEQKDSTLQGSSGGKEK